MARVSLDVPNSADRDSSAFRVAEMYYAHGMEQAEIARELDISSSTVSRLLDHARGQHLVEFVLVPPFHTLLAQQLQSQLDGLGIRKVIVTEAEGRRVVGQAAAWYFDQRAPDETTVVLDGGWTVRDFVVALPRQTRRAVTLLPIAADPPSYKVSALELSTLFASKCLKAHVHKVPHLTNLVPSKTLKARHREIVKVASRADLVVLGIGPWELAYTALEFVQDLGLEPLRLKRLHPNIAAVTGYLPISAQGKQVLVKEINKYMPHALPFEALRHSARQSDRCVMLVAASASKASAVLAALRARVCNTLVLDHPLALALLELLPESERNPH